MSQKCSIGESSGDLASQGRVLTARRQSRDIRVTRRWSSVSKVRWDSSLNTMGRQSDGVAAVAEWYRYRTVACLVTSSSPVPLKTLRVGQRCTLTFSRWCGVVIRRGVPAQVSSTSLDQCSKLRGPSPKALV
ncbi:uncharacterized protein TNCV_279051 [Trichonephila clavipes]|nr:uncharacterized protein TNCV_279051 [Trichonephila clavipes]